MPFDPINPRQSFPDLERAILQYWKEEDVFRRTVRHRDHDDPLEGGGRGGGHFGFYDGPPFATGLPHYGHLLAGTIKDVIPRYQTMRGKRVPRRFGWDCHGLPIEALIEKEHGIRDKREIDEKGVAWFNGLCRASVQRYTGEWRQTVERMGRWVDMDWDYRTMDADYMESIWWALAEVHAKGLLYEGKRPIHICPRCATPLSNFEVGQGYKDVTDESATVMFAVQDAKETGESAYFLAWTTTPWTLPGNLFLAVHPAVTYATVESDGTRYILAEELVERVFGERDHRIVGKGKKGKSLVGTHYRPLFPYFQSAYGDAAFRVVAGDFVTTEDGTGIVHIAPGFGEDDFGVWLQEKKAGNDLPLLQHVTIDGHFVDAVTDFAGEEVKPADDPSKTDKKITAWLEKQHALFARESYRHSYPHCWRCDTPLLNYATASWFVAVEKIKEQLLTNAEAIAWMPAHLKEGRFGKWLENARDWSISRNRYWGTPLPIWKAGDQIDILAGRDDLMARHRVRFTKITTVRHGESHGNVTPVYQGVPPGTDLTERGQQQAAMAGAWLRRDAHPVTRIYCSPLARTQQTAQAIATATGANIIVDDRLRETGFGDYEGKAVDFSDLAIVRARRAKKLESGQPESIYHLPGMEPWADQQERIASFFAEILPQHRSDHIVIVTHADPIQGIRHFFTQEDPFKLSHQPYARYATPQHFFWDHATTTAMDLHKEYVDDIAWPSGSREEAVEAVFVRHGETDWNANGTVQGRGADIPLNENGRAQIAALAATLQQETFDAVVSSSLLRATESARILADALGIEHVVELSQLDERDSGDWNGQPRDAVLASLPASPAGTRLAFNPATPENGEALDVFLARARSGWQELQQQYAGKRILVVAHGGMLQALRCLAENLPFADAATWEPANAEVLPLLLTPLFRRIPDVLDCWFESGSMPYAQENYPYAFTSHAAGADAFAWMGDDTAEAVKTFPPPPSFPADFIAEGVDQTRLWFYTLHVLSTILFHRSAYRNVVVNGIVLAEDGKKMSKRLKNYPDPTAILEEHGADALRFALMSSPAVRAEDLRFSSKTVAETVRSVLLPLWNSYSFFVTYANEAQWEPTPSRAHSSHPLDRWIRAETQDLVNRMTTQLDAYDLSATCAELHATIDALTNWYIRLSRRRFAGKGTLDTHADTGVTVDDRNDALSTLYDVLLTISQLLAPFCPYVTEAMYLNLVADDHGSIHLTDWPQTRELPPEERALLTRTRLLRTIVSLGLTIRSDAKVKQRQPLAQATIALPPALRAQAMISDDDVRLLAQELNVKDVCFADDPGTLGERYLQIDARKVGPRFGSKVQELIAAGKRGEFEEKDGQFFVLDETMSTDEARVLYRGREGEDIAADGGIVVSLDMRITEALRREGLLRDLIRGVQVLRKDAGLTISDTVALHIDGVELSDQEKTVLQQETRSVLQENDGQPQTIDVENDAVTVRFVRVES